MVNLFKKIVFRDPKKAKYVLYDSMNGHFITDLILKDEDVETLYARYEKFYLGPMIIINFLFSLNYFDFSHFKTISLIDYPKAILGRLYRIYLVSFLKTVKAKVVMTYVDDDMGFCWLSKNYKGAKFFAIQNGVRDKVGVGRLINWRKFDLQNFFCFGEAEINLYNELEHNVGTFIPVGSLKGSYYYNCIAPKQISPEFDICTVSCWDRAVMVDNKGRGEFKLGMTRQHEYLNEAINKYNLSVIVALRGDDPGELEFFENIYQGKVSYQKFDLENYSTYQAMNKAKLTIATLSTTLREHFGRNNKVMWCNFTEDEFYDLPIKGRWFYKDLNREKFCQHLKDYLDLSQEEFEKESKQAQKYLMQYPEIPTHEKIKKIVEAYV